MPKIVFFNHFHRGDLHTHKEFIRQIKNECPDFTYEYYHNNPEKLTNELHIMSMGAPLESLDMKSPFYQDEDTLYINTWVGCFWDIFCQHGGINMHTLYDQWEIIYETINDQFGTTLKLRESKESYMPKIDFSLLNTESIDYYVRENADAFKVLVCNNVPSSNQSFSSDMEEFINPLAEKYPGAHFILTNKINATSPNIIYTSDLIDIEDPCDLLEISYLSSHCNVIVGKNSGPYVFCETYDNYMDENKTFISYNTKHQDYDDVKETMSNGLELKCKYKAIPILSNSLTPKDRENVMASLEEALQ